MERNLLDGLNLVSKWKGGNHYEDVKETFLKNPSDDQMVNECPHGCSLDVHKHNDDRWITIMEIKDCYRQTRFCREHHYARIYVTTGLAAIGANYRLVKGVPF